MYFWIVSPLALAAMVSAGVAGLYRGRVAETLQTTSQAGLDLRVLEGALKLLEESAFTSEMMVEVQARIRRDGPAASERIAKLAHLAEWIDSLDNAAFQLRDLLFLFSLHLSRAADRWRRSTLRIRTRWLLRGRRARRLWRARRCGIR